MGYLIKCKHEKQVLAQFFCTMKIQSSKNKVIRTIDFRRQVLLVQDIFNALKDYKNRQNTKRELHQAQIKMLILQKKRRLLHRLRLGVLLRKKKIATQFASGMHYRRTIQYNAFKKLFLYCRLKKSLKRTQRRVQMKNSMSLKIKFFKKFVSQFEKTVTERRKNETLSLGEELEGFNRSPNGKELHLQALMSARTI